MANKIGMADPPDFEFFLSDSNTTETESCTSTGTDNSGHQVVETERKRTRRQRKRRRVRYMTSEGTQTDSLFLMGNSVSLGGPVVDQYMSDRAEIDCLNILIESLLREIEKRQSKVTRLEKESLRREAEVVTQKMQTFSLQAKQAVSKQIIQEFAEKIKIVTEELAKEKLARENEREDEDPDTQSVD